MIRDTAFSLRLKKERRIVEEEMRPYRPAPAETARPDMIKTITRYILRRVRKRRAVL